MQKTTFVIHAFIISTLITIISGICYAETYSVPLTIGCYKSIQDAEWISYKASPKTQYTLTTVGMFIKKENVLATLWYDDDEENDYENPIEYGLQFGLPQVIARCTSSLVDTDMYAYPKGTPPPVLACPKGDGIKIRFIAPNSPNPEDFVYHAILTVTRDDEETRTSQPSQATTTLSTGVDFRAQLPNLNPPMPSATFGGFTSFGSR